MHESETMLSLYYGLATSVVYVCLWVSFVGVWVFLHKMIVAEKRRDRKAMRGNGGAAGLLYNANANKFTTSSHLQHEMRNVGMILVLVLIYLLLLCPYLITVKIDQALQVLNCCLCLKSFTVDS